MSVSVFSLSRANRSLTDGGEKVGLRCVLWLIQTERDRECRDEVPYFVRWSVDGSGAYVWRALVLYVS